MHRNPATYPCSRCGGSGRMPYSLRGGVCFKCDGYGTQRTKPPAKPQRWAVYFPWLTPSEKFGTHFITYQSGKNAAAALAAATTRIQGGTVWQSVTPEGAFAISEEEDKPREKARAEISAAAYQEAQFIESRTGVWPSELFWYDRGIPVIPVFVPPVEERTVPPRFAISDRGGTAGSVVWLSTAVQNPTPRTFTPPPAVADAARHGLDLRASLPPSKRGGTDVGLRRAVQLANRQPVSVDTLKRMRSYFQRHAVDAQGRGWGHDSRGWVAWLLWGSDEGNQWCNQILDRLGV